MIRAFALFAFTLLLSVAAQAGAWTQDTGHGEAITTLSFNNTNGSFNAQSNRVGRQSRYRKYELNVFAEYGLREAYTAGFQASYQNIYARSNDTTNHNSNLADTAFFLRERLWHNNSSAFAIQQLFTVPGTYRTGDPSAPGYGQNDVEMRALYGNAGKIGNTPYYLDLQGAYRKRFQSPADELRLDASFGIMPWDDFTLLFQSFNTRGLRNNSGSVVENLSGPDYDLSKVQISGVFQMEKNLSLQIGAGADIAGRNTGAGKTVFLAVGRKF